MMVKTSLWKFVVLLVEMKQHYLREIYYLCTKKYAESQGWRVEVMDANVTGIGGYKELF